MTSATAPILVALVLQLALGLVVFQANWHRRSNQCFLLLSCVTAGWLASLYFAEGTRNAQVAASAIRAASAAGVFALVVFNLLRVSTVKRSESWRVILADSKMWLVSGLVLAAFAQTKFFLKGAQFSQRGELMVPSPVYWVPGQIFYFSCLAAMGLTVIVNYARDVKRSSGSERLELTFILIAAGVAVGTIVLASSLAVVIDPSRVVWFAPFRAVLFSLIIAYGIATRKIMDVGLFLRRLISYSLLTIYLLAIYALVWWLLGAVLGSAQISGARSIAHVAAGITVAFAMAPARGVSRRLAERLLISTQQLDFRVTVSKATEILSSITTLHDLLQRFGGTIAEAVAAERVLILLAERGGFSTSFAFSHNGGPPEDCRLPLDGPIASYLKTHREPVVLEELYRVRPTPDIVRLAERMRESNLAVAMGIFSREHLAGIMLLGPRMSGRIYGSMEQNALQVLCGQLAVAIENAQLFTEVQNARIYNETLLQNLTTGVIAAGVDERITVFNNEAGQITGIEPTRILDRAIDELPGPVRDALRETLQTGEGQNSEHTLEAGPEGVVVRISTSIFHGQDRQVLGALMVLTDVTALKRLELQIRRSDRLASLGTLSAGMAHEIKNPLVSIKTFAQLLPERYHDSEFRETFSNLIGHEIDRIDSLVNQLLRFARPAKPHLKPMHVHDIMEKSLLLVGHRLYQKDIKLARFLEADVDTIRADSDQLEQVFLNFFINAMDAMKNGGELCIRTEIRTGQPWISPLRPSNGETQEFLRISIRDSGEGIRSEDLAHVFDPFFTTKDYGTGLGLSVVHGIVQEHGGQIEVESELKRGTAFHILLPLVRFDSKVVAA